MWKSSSFLLIFSFIVIKTLLFIVILPPWQGPDEPFHFKMAYILADPLIDIRKLDAKMVESLQEHRFPEYSDYTQKNDRILRVNTSKLSGYYQILSFLFKSFWSFSLIGKMFLGRCLSAACYLVIVILVYDISRRILSEAEGHWLSIAALSFVGFQPQYSFFSITLNSDNLITLLLTVTLLCLVHMAPHGQEQAEKRVIKRWPLLVAILAVVMGLMVKTTGLVGFLLFSVSMFIVVSTNRRSLAKAGAACIALLALFASFVFFSGLEEERRTKCVNQFSVSFKGVPGDVEVSYEAFDIDCKGEVLVLLNKKKVAYVKKTKDNAWGPADVLSLSDKDVEDNTENVLTFNNVHNPPSRYSWGVRNIQIANIIRVEEPHGNIPQSEMLEGFTPEERKPSEGEYKSSIMAKWSARVGEAIHSGLGKLRDVSGLPLYLIVRFILVQFVSFWFSLGWMIYKMSLGWYVFFGLITFLSVFGLIRLVYARFRNRGFEFMNMRSVSLLILLFALSQLAMVIVYGPSPDTSINTAMGRCRFMEIGALSILIPLGLWALLPARRRDMVMKSFVCFMIFLNIVSVTKYIIPIFYL